MYEKSATSNASRGAAWGAELQFLVEQFLYSEAELLDSHEYTEWLKLFTEDAYYWMPVRKTLRGRDIDDQVAGPGEGAFFEDDISMLRGRVRRITSGLQWSEEPPSRTRRVLGNVRIVNISGDSIKVRTNFIIYRSRLERKEDWYVGERYDLLRQSKGKYPFKISGRKIVLDQATLLAPNISIFL